MAIATKYMEWARMAAALLVGTGIGGGTGYYVFPGDAEETQRHPAIARIEVLEVKVKLLMDLPEHKGKIGKVVVIR